MSVDGLDVIVTLAVHRFRASESRTTTRLVHVTVNFASANQVTATRFDRVRRNKSLSQLTATHQRERIGTTRVLVNRRTSTYSDGRN